MQISKLSATVILCVSLFNVCPEVIAKRHIKEENLALANHAAQAGGAHEHSFSGNISWYGKQFQGKKTASGELFDMHKCTSAHRTLPFHTKVLVEDPKTGSTVLVKVNDRGPFVKSRVMDVSMEAAKKLGTIGRGMAFVDCMVISDAK
jgi:rare lipoprotein A